jgi:hypothetical protein
MVGVNSRALHLARRAESCRIFRNNPSVREAENDQQCNRHLNPETRSCKQSVNTDRRAAACKDEQVKEAEMSNNTIDGRFLNIGNRNNLSTQIDEPLHAMMNK